MESRRVLRLLWLICCVFITTGIAASEPELGQSIALEQVGSFEHFLHSGLLIAPEISFVDNDRIAVTFLNPCSVNEWPHLENRYEKQIPCGLTLTVLFVDRKTSKIEESLSLPFHTLRQSQPSAPHGFRLLSPTRRGEFVVHTGDFLLRYGPNLEVVEKRQIGNPDRSRVYVSPDGRLVLLNEYEDVNKFRKFIFPSDDIQGGKFFGEGWPSEGIMDDGVVLASVWNTATPNSNSTNSTKGRPDAQRHLAPHLALCASQENCRALNTFGWRINNTTFATRVNGRKNTKKFEIFDRTGKTIYVGSTSQPVSDFVAGSPASESLVIISRTDRIGSTQFGFDVLNLHSLEVSMRVTLKSKGIKHGGSTIMRAPTAAVSPDGAYVAILVGAELRLYHYQGQQ